MPSLQPRIDFQKRIEAYSTLSANLLTELGELELLREIIRQAEVAAKVAFLLGAEQGSEFLRRHSLAGLLVQEDGTWATVGSWPRETLPKEG